MCTKLGFHKALTDAESKILITIAEKGEKTYKQLFEKENIANSNRTILYSLKHLEYMELITSKIGKNERSSSRGRKSTYYNLSSDGLILSLYYMLKLDDQEQNYFELIEKIALKQKKLLPLIFGKWKFFKKHNMNEVATLRLYATLKIEGTNLEKWVESRRQRMQKGLKFQSRLKQMNEELKKYLSESELKNFPRHPVFMSPNEKEKHLNALFKAQREIFKDFENPEWKIYGNSEVDKILEDCKIIDECAEKITLERFTDSFFFGSKRLIIKLDNQAEFLKIIIKDSDLRKYAQEYYQNEELNQKKRYEYTLYLKDLSETD